MITHELFFTPKCFSVKNLRSAGFQCRW